MCYFELWEVDERRQPCSDWLSRCLWKLLWSCSVTLIVAVICLDLFRSRGQLHEWWVSLVVRQPLGKVLRYSGGPCLVTGARLSWLMQLALVQKSLTICKGHRLSAAGAHENAGLLLTKFICDCQYKPRTCQWRQMVSEIFVNSMPQSLHYPSNMESHGTSKRLRSS